MSEVTPFSVPSDLATASDFSTAGLGIRDSLAKLVVLNQLRKKLNDIGWLETEASTSKSLFAVAETLQELGVSQAVVKTVIWASQTPGIVKLVQALWKLSAGMVPADGDVSIATSSKFDGELVLGDAIEKSLASGSEPAVASQGIASWISIAMQVIQLLKFVRDSLDKVGS